MADQNWSVPEPSTETPADALRRIARRPPNQGETVLLSLAWLLEPATGLGADQAIEWLRRWRQATLEFFTEDQIPPRFRVLAGVCLQWRDDWPGKAGTTAQRHQQAAADLLDASGPTHCDWVRIEAPLDRLKRGELRAFFQQQLSKGRECLHGLEPDDLARWVLAQQGGRFEPTVDLIYHSCKKGFAQARNRPGAGNRGADS